MAGMIVQHNLNAINANNKLGVNVNGTKKSTEKLSSGFRINRAADDAAGLAISEKMRAQLKGLDSAIRNSNDGISLIQTAEGALDETHSMLKRLKELAVLSGNDTYSAEEREYMQMEIDEIKTEIDRIAEATEFNGIKLLNGDLGGMAGTNGLGARYGYIETAAGALEGSSVTSSIIGVTVEFGDEVTAKGAEYAAWDTAGTTLTINVSAGTTYTQSQIDDLIKNADRSKVAQVSAIPEVSVKLASNVVTLAGTEAFGPTVAGVQATSTFVDVTAFYAGGEQEGYADEMRITANSYGVDETKFTLKTSKDSGVIKGKETVTSTAGATNKYTNAGRTFDIELATGVDYTAKDIQNILAKAGLDYSVELQSKVDGTKVVAPTGDLKFRATVADSTGKDFDMTTGAGAGLGKEYTGGGSSGDGLTFQIGANNASEQRVNLNISNMSSDAIGIATFDVSTVDTARTAMSNVEGAISNVSRQRASLGAMQNRLEHTVNNLTVTTENLNAAEAQIRDTDMATEMVEYTKYNILQQAAQAMLAQANQAPQAILQLLR